jgi:protein-S-isoprenylcysteine O-methyltransferase Ste14
VLALKSILAALVLPGTVTLLIPYLILAQRGFVVGQLRPMQCLGVVLIAAGAAILVRCIVDFARIGRGTLAPVDPPRTLVVRGLYRYVRNPMYVGVLAILLGEAALFRALVLLEYTAIWFACVHLFVVLYEEPALQRQFDGSFEQYRRSVRRWFPGKP